MPQHSTEPASMPHSSTEPARAAPSAPGVSWSLTKAAVDQGVDQALRESHTVKTLVQAMARAGCPAQRDFFKVLSCDTQTGGGFSIEHGVVLCHNQLQSYSDVESTMAHELVHAYDYCRLPGMDFQDCQQHACSEVRAANLSGDCALMQEFLRGNLALSDPSSWAGLRERCVRRRAALSVAMNPGCGGVPGAAAAVDAVVSGCMADCDPF